jgi:hypothetical protein
MAHMRIIKGQHPELVMVGKGISYLEIKYSHLRKLFSNTT